MRRRTIQTAGVLVILLLCGVAVVAWRIWKGHVLLHAAQSGNVTLVSAAVQGRPDEAQLWVLLGDAYAARRDYANAVGAYEKAIQLDPGDETSWWLMGHAQVCRANATGSTAAEVGLRRLNSRSADEFTALARNGCCAFGGCRE